MKHISALMLIVTLFAAAAFAQTKLLRFPDIHGDKIVFSYGGDLWLSTASGGSATRLTAHPGVEVFAKFSPDGNWIAFTGQYDGDEQVYVVPSNGGEPKQLTFYPAKGPFAPRWGWDNLVYGWSRDGKYIIFKSQRDSWTLPVAKLYRVPVSGGSAEALPMPEAGSGDYSPDGTKMVYSPRSRDFRPEKRYGGGQANTLYIYDNSTNDAIKISDGVRPSRDPMWIGDKIFYNSDKDGKFNLYSYDTKTSKTAQVTANRDWDIRWCSSDNDSRIVYERNGEIEVLNTKTNKAQKLAISVPDDGINKRIRRINSARWMENFALSPKGERALFAARGDIFTAPIEKGNSRNLTRSSNAHDKAPAWSPDGRSIAYISDRTGEEEIWLEPQDGSGVPIQLTTGGKAQRYSPQWSSDSKKLLFSDKDGKLFQLNVATKAVVQIADARNGFVNDYDFSPKGNFVSFTMSNPNGFSSVFVWSETDSKTHRVTDPLFNASNPVWDPSGNYIFFTSEHEFAPQISASEWNYATNRMTQIYALALRKDVKNPFPTESDEVAISEEKPTSAPTAKPATADTIDFDGIVRRVTKAPIPADNISGLSANRNGIFYSVGTAFYYGRAAENLPSLRMLAFRDRKITTLAEPAFGWTMSSDGSKIMYSAMGGYTLIDAGPLGPTTRKSVSTAGLIADVNPTEEWNQIFNEVWRRYRDWFYVENMHGFDWVKIREDYKKWLPYVAHRSDLNYVIAEMCAELTVQHAYIDGGDFNLPPRTRVALLGARFEADQTAKKYKFSKIFAGQNEEDIYRSPLSEVGTDVKTGDYLIAIDGEPVSTEKDIYSYLRGKPETVQITVNSTPSADGARTFVVNTVSDETSLNYLEWVTANREKVSQLTNGRVGYLHIPDMGAPGIREFIKWYYGQLDKEGLIVDVRANGGGNVSRMIIERLRRKVLGVSFRRNETDAFTYPDGVFIGPMAALLNENSASDGDIFPYMFRESGLGPLIGKRSWGGVVGITNRGMLIDGGVTNVPEFSLANTKGEYVIEGYGVDPDIEVENDPKSVIAGKDPQLERAVQEVMKKLATPVKLPSKPKEPVKAND